MTHEVDKEAGALKNLELIEPRRPGHPWVYEIREPGDHLFTCAMYTSEDSSWALAVMAGLAEQFTADDDGLLDKPVQEIDPDITDDGHTMYAVAFIPATETGSKAFLDDSSHRTVIVGVTHDEYIFTKQYGIAAIWRLLEAAEHGIVTKPNRPSVLQDESLEPLIESLTTKETISRTASSSNGELQPSHLARAKELMEQSRLDTHEELLHKVSRLLEGLPKEVDAIGVTLDEQGEVLLKLAPAGGGNRPWWQFW